MHNIFTCRHKRSSQCQVDVSSVGKYRSQIFLAGWHTMSLVFWPILTGRTVYFNTDFFQKIFDGIFSDGLKFLENLSHQKQPQNMTDLHEKKRYKLQCVLTRMNRTCLKSNYQSRLACTVMTGTFVKCPNTYAYTNQWLQIIPRDFLYFCNNLSLTFKEFP